MRNLNIFIKSWLAILLLLGLAACSGGSSEPSEDDIKNKISFQLPNGLVVDDLEILVSENAGTEVEPLIRSRSKVTLKFTDAFVTVEERYGSKVVLREQQGAGQTISGTVISSATLKGESWNVAISKLDIPRIRGQALSEYSEGSYAFVGTDEAAAFKAAHEAELAAEAQAKAEAIAKAAAEKAARIEKFREFLAGTWASKAPLMRNGSLYVSRRNRLTAGMEITFPDGTGVSDTAEVILYEEDNPLSKLVVRAGFTVAEDGKSVRIGLNNRAQHRALELYFNEVWQMGEDGILWTGQRDKWSIAMEKEGPALAAKRAMENHLVKRDDAIEKLLRKHKAGLAPNQFEDTGLKDRTYGLFFVEAQKGGDRRVWGDTTYTGRSSIALATIHSGALAEGELGVVKIAMRWITPRTDIVGTIRNGVQSDSRNAYDHYSVELVEKLKLD